MREDTGRCIACASRRVGSRGREGGCLAGRGSARRLAHDFQLEGGRVVAALLRLALLSLLRRGCEPRAARRAGRKDHAASLEGEELQKARRLDLLDIGSGFGDARDLLDIGSGFGVARDRAELGGRLGRRSRLGRRRCVSGQHGQTRVMRGTEFVRSDRPPRRGAELHCEYVRRSARRQIW